MSVVTPQCHLGRAEPRGGHGQSQRGADVHISAALYFSRYDSKQHPVWESTQPSEVQSSSESLRPEESENPFLARFLITFTSVRFCQ